MPLARIVTVLLLLLVLGMAVWIPAREAAAASSRALKIATWNLQWLLEPATLRLARIACRDQRRTTVPCDVARAQSRDSADFRRLAALVRRLDADVIAFQEVESEAVARRVFRDHRFCFPASPGLQHAGFAVRNGLDFRCDPPLESLAAQDRGRPGQPLTLLPREARPIELLAVHLKSGCARDALDTDSAACTLLSLQARELGAWIAERAEATTPFIVLGDLNRGGLPAHDDPFWSQLHPASFEAAASRLPFRNCVIGAPYGEFIDHILVSQDLLPELTRNGFTQMRFDPQEASEYRLSDHCPVSVSLSLKSTL